MKTFATINMVTWQSCVRHQRAVNIVRWSPDGQLLASGDDESIIIIWKVVDVALLKKLLYRFFRWKRARGAEATSLMTDLRTTLRTGLSTRWSGHLNYLGLCVVQWTMHNEPEAISMYAQDIFFRSKYRVYFRSHLDDIYDLAWSPCSNYLLSGRW